jgi:hypothetical protein
MTKSKAVKEIEEHAIDPFLEGANLDTRGFTIHAEDLALDTTDPFKPDERFGS